MHDAPLASTWSFPHVRPPEPKSVAAPPPKWKVRVAPLRLMTVMVWAVEVDPTGTWPKSNDRGVTCRAGPPELPP